jgi:hypothetical protein
MKLLAVGVLAVIWGCGLYWGNSSGDDTCGDVNGGAATVERDPTTGACVAPPPDPCPCGHECATPLIPPTESCSGPCELLDEASCLATANCHAAYSSLPAFDTPPPPPADNFLGCWDIAPLPTLEGGPCVENAALACSQHDDCVSVIPDGEFSTCADKPTHADGCGSGCGSGYECGVSCAGASCTTTCIATGELGTCNTPVACQIAAPACPAGSTPGVVGQCWSGYCIPDAECATGCTGFTTATACTAGDCTAVYQGSGCTCYSNGTCDCASETFESCE